MTENKNLKARVRARMERTGESYTAALAQLTKEDDAANAMPSNVGEAQALDHMFKEVANEKARAQSWPQTQRGGVDTARAFPLLVSMFPSLRGVSGTDPWDAMRLLGWLCRGGTHRGAFHAARFVLSVWGGHTDWNAEAHSAGLLAEGERLAGFDVFDAVAVWDTEHRNAFTAWVSAPFWP